MRVIDELAKLDFSKSAILPREWTSVGQFSERFDCFFKSLVPTHCCFRRALISDVSRCFDGFVARFIPKYDLVPHDPSLALVVDVKAFADVGEYFACGYARCAVVE